jgi:RNA polymerase sigma-70 factor (ECF subfamily)
MPGNRHEWFLSQVCCHRAALHRYLRKFASCPEDIEDLVQETLTRVYALPDFQALESPRAMLFSIAHNLAVERARRITVQATDSMADLECLNVFSSEGAPEEQLDARRRFELFCAAVEQLPPVCRRAFVLRKVHQLSHVEIAEVLNVAQSTIEKHVAKGLVRCKKYLQDRGLFESADERGVKLPRAR